MSSLELDVLEQFIKDASAKFSERRRVRELNTSESNYDSPNSNLDSSIKKNSAFVKRLRVYCEGQRAQILDEIDRLNLTKFISEVAAAIVEAKIKLSDVPSIIEICTKLNQKYKDFNKLLLDQYVRYLPAARRKNHEHIGSNQATTNHSSSCSNLAKITSPKNTSCDLSPISQSKIRVDLRLFSELIIYGVIPLKEGFPVLMNLLCYLMVQDKNAHQNASAILVFCKGCGEELIGLVPKEMQQLAIKYDRELPVSDLISVKRQNTLRGHIRDYYQWLVNYLKNSHEELEQLVIRSKRATKARGDASRDLREVVETKATDLRKVQGVVCQLADILGEELPCFSDIENLMESSDLVSGRFIDGSPDSSLQVSFKTSSLWDDENTRSFYEDLLDLKQIFPELTKKIHKDGSKPTDNIKNKSPSQDDRVETSPNDEGVNLTMLISEKVSREDCSENVRNLDSSSSDENIAASEPLTVPKNTIILSRQNRSQPDQYFAKLSSCVNRDMIDNTAIDFIKFFNTKFGRKKLIRTLFNVQRTRLDLLPFYARLTSTLYPYVPSVGNELVALLKAEFKNLFKKKDQINIESKVKNVRFIGELAKFSLFSTQDVLHCLKLLLSDFTHHHIEMTCNMLETCGRLLYKSPDSHHQLKLLLEQMMRKKLLLSVDSKYVTMIENAYYFTNPPELVKHVVEEPPIHNYVRYLLYERLNRSTIDKVLRKIKLLDWNDINLAKFVIHCMTEAYNLKFYNTRYLAALLAALNKDHQWVSIIVVDNVVEDILLMMEVNEIHFNQRRIPMIRYFGELYNYRLTDSSLVFKILYSLITYEVFYPEPHHTLNQILLSRLDPPDNLFRIKLVCDLLDTCGQYLNSSQEKKKLDCYLLFFQRYYWCKKYIYTLHPYCMVKSGNQFPASIEFLYNDVVYNLRPSFVMASSYQHAIQLLQNFLNNLTNED